MSHDSADNKRTAVQADDAYDPIIAQIVQTLRGLRYGVVSIVVQDGVVVQIERTEKHRVRRSAAT
jgi:hypothetical protein